MRNVKTSYFELEGTHYEIGQQMAKLLGKEALHSSPPDFIMREDLDKALSFLDQYCPGIIEELRGFSDETGFPVQENVYTWTTYLTPHCSSIAMLPSHTQNGHTMIARNYEFSIEDEDFHVYRLAPKGKYAHIGGSLIEFGRTEGINECGLAVSMSSCGIPVSNIPSMRSSAICGLHFWAVVRTLLDTCKDVNEALQILQDMPIAFNINLILADRNQNIAIVETMNGEMAVQRGGNTGEPTYLSATNHIAIGSFQDRENFAMRNSVVRYETIQKFVKGSEKVAEQQLKDFLLTQYPEGMTCWYYKDWFGTVKSVVMDVNEGRFSICWGGRPENGWDDYYVDKKIGNSNKEITILHEQGNKEFFECIPL